jgi:hypothetical protein
VPYDVFISYSSLDRSWAERLAADLGERGVKCFFDHKSLRDGPGWEQQIKVALTESRHIVCLWSKAAKESVWVGRELATFDVLHPSEAEGSLLLKVLLDETPSAYASRQLVRVEPMLQAYEVARPPWPGDDWLALVTRVQRSVKQDLNVLTIPVALLTLTQGLVSKIGVDELMKIADQLELDGAALAARYGNSRLEWRPFIDSTASIGALIDQVKVELDQRLAPRSVHFEFPDETFWADHETAQTWVKAMKERGIGAIVIDPVALSMVGVHTRLSLFAQVLGLENVSILALHPQQASDRATKFRRWMKEFAASVVHSHFDPPLAAEIIFSARCSIGLDDPSEMRRLLQACIGQSLRRPAAAGQPASPIVGT